MTEIRYIKVAVRWVRENAKLHGYAEIKDELRIHLTVNSVEETIYDGISTVIRWLLAIRNASSIKWGHYAPIFIGQILLYALYIYVMIRVN